MFQLYQKAEGWSA